MKPAVRCLIGVLLASTLSALQARAQAAGGTASAASHDYSFTISTAQPWTDTNIKLQPGDSIAITAASAGCDPQGLASASAANLPVPSAAAGALIAKLQTGAAAGLVGSTRDIQVTEAGELFLGVNALGTPPCEGSFAVKVQLTNSSAAAEQAQTKSQGADLKRKLSNAAQVWLAGQFGTGSTAASGNASAAASNNATPGNTASTGNTAATATPALKISDAPLDAALCKDLDGLPRRVNDEFNNLGDMVNFVLVGSQQQVQNALAAADWHVADTNNQQAVVQAVLQTYQKKDYLAMPMSKLMLFGRYQDYGYEQAEPIAMVASRHHFRIWKAPFTWNGQQVWVGAGTHDIGFEKDQRNGKITHKIDPAVDGERDNVGGSLQKADQVKNLSYYLPPDPVQQARNATGGGYHSDGRILVVFLK